MPARLGYLGLGSNIGERRENLAAAVRELPTHGVEVLASSSVYDTEPVGLVLDQPEFLNACVRMPDRAWSRGSCSTPARRSSVSSAERRGGVRHGPR